MKTENAIRKAAIEDLAASETFESGHDNRCIASSLSYLGYDHEEHTVAMHFRTYIHTAIAALRRKDSNLLDSVVLSPLETAPC